MNRTNTVSKPKEALVASKVIEQTPIMANANYVRFSRKENIMSANFKLTFKNKNILVEWESELPKQKTQVYGEYGHTGEVSEWVSALTHQMAGTYPIQGSGKFLHRTYEDALKAMKDDNVGYLSGSALMKEIEAGVMPARENVDVEVWYRVHSRYSAVKDANEFWTEELKWQDEVKGEPRFVTHNRNTLALLPYLMYLRKAEATNTPVSLLFSEKIMFLYEGLKANWEHFQNGEIDLIKASMNKNAVISNFKTSIDQAEAYAQKMEEAGTPVAVVEMGTDAPAIGTRITFYFTETGLDLVGQYRDVTEDNLFGIVNAMKSAGLGWKLAPAAVQAKGRNVPQPVE